jgi:hypothetical protein
MSTSNFLPWGPATGSAQQETDAEYLGDSNRANGAPLNSLFASALANKLFLQVTAMVYALGQFMVGQGFDASDANLSTLVTNLTSAILSVLIPKIVGVIWSAHPTFATPNPPTPIVIFEITLSGNVTGGTLTNFTEGVVYIFIVHQDSTGGRGFVWPSGIPGAAVDPGANKTSIQMFLTDSLSNAHPLGPLTSS